MTSPSPPVIEFPKTLSTTSSATDNQVVHALEKYGCFMATYDNLKGCHKTLEKKLPELFKASKEKFVHLDKITSDYFAYTSNRQYESFGIPKATTDEGTNKFITSLWPEGNGDMGNAIGGYTKTAAELGEKVMKIVIARYGVPHGFKTGYIFRMMKYREVRLDFSDHKDRVEFLAVLDLNQDNDLEMRTKDGQRFSIAARPSTFLIMAGKPLTGWSKGEIHHQEHGVTMRGKEEKYSVGLFSYCDKGKIEGPKEKVGSSSIGKGKTEASKEQVGN